MWSVFRALCIGNHGLCMQMSCRGNAWADDGVYRNLRMVGKQSSVQENGRQIATALFILIITFFCKRQGRILTLEW